MNLLLIKFLLILSIIILLVLILRKINTIQIDNYTKPKLLAGWQGWTVSLSSDGNTLAVGSPQSLPGSPTMNIVFIWTRSGSNWTQESIISDNTNGNRQSCVSLSQDGNTLAIGIYNFLSKIGIVKIYTKSDNNWENIFTQQVGEGSQGYGNGYEQVSLSFSGDGNTLAIGTYFDNNFQGTVWIFTRSGSSWTQQGKLTDSIVWAAQGFSVALSDDGNTLASGGQEATWIYTRSGSTWTQQGSKLSIGGYVLSLSADGNTLAIGNKDTGSYIFTRTNSTWSQQQIINNGGQSLSLSENILVTGNNSVTEEIGTFWVFTKSGNIWSQGTKLVGNGLAGWPGRSYVCLSSDTNTLAVGSYTDNYISNNYSIGAVCIFTRSGSTWTQQGSKLVGVIP